MANYPAFYPQPNAPMYGQMPMYQQPYMGPQAPIQTVPMQGNTSPQVPGQPAFTCCPVTSKEEAVATRVEAFGPAVIMPDLGHGMIYYKRFNQNTALADFAQFRIVPDEVENKQAEQKTQAPAIDFGAIIGAFQGRFDSIESKMDDIVEKLSAKPPQKQAANKGAQKE